MGGGGLIVVLIDQGDSFRLKFFECLLAELEIEQECVTSFFNTFVGRNCLTDGLSDIDK
jgi:hypothetical protein